MRKCQSFGFDVLLTIIIVLLFNQILYLNSYDYDSSLLLERRVENAQVLYLLLEYNNSLAYLDSFTCNNNIESFDFFNDSTEYFLRTYINNREYLLIVNGFIYSSEGVNSVCLEKASPVHYSINGSCNNVLNFEFSIYTKGEKVPC